MPLLPERIDRLIRNKIGIERMPTSGAGKALLRSLYILADSFADEQTELRASSLVYASALAFVPLLAVSFSLLKAFGINAKLEMMLYYLLEPLGEKGIDVSLRVITFVENMNVTVLGAVGVITLLYTAVSTISKIETALNSIWRVEESRPFAERFSTYLSVLLVGPVLVFTAISLIISLKSAAIVRMLLSYELVGLLVIVAGKIFPYLLACAAFTLIYIFLPHTRVRFRSALAGGISAAIAWGVMGWAFASFVATSAKYSAVYSGLAALFLFIIWLYWNWVILLAGARVSFYHQQPGAFGGEQRVRRSEAALRQVAFGVAALVCNSFMKGEKQPDADALVSSLCVPADVVSEVLSSLTDKGLLVSPCTAPPSYVPSRPPDTISLKEVADAVSEGDFVWDCDPATVPFGAEIVSLVNGMEGAAWETLGKKSVQDLITLSQK